jgi:ubiquinone/menaquinone biosynthesis C-methylase UbiE
MDQPDDPAARVAKLFDELAEDYDQTGVPFFQPIARGLVDQLALARGERVLEVGCGRGAVTFPAAEAVGTTGSVLAVDIAPEMVAQTQRRADELGVPNVRTAVVGADDLGLPDSGFDVVASSLVLFFAPDPLAALRSWVPPLVPGGRIGIATFGEADPVWRSIDDLFGPYLPPALLDARTSGATGPFASDAGVEGLMTDAGVAGLRTVVQRLRVPFADAAEWGRFSMATGQRMFWRFVPEEHRADLFARAAALLEGTRDDDGRLSVWQDVRYTLGVTPT